MQLVIQQHFINVSGIDNQQSSSHSSYIHGFFVSNALNFSSSKFIVVKLWDF